MVQSSFFSTVEKEESDKGKGKEKMGIWQGKEMKDREKNKKIENDK